MSTHKDEDLNKLLSKTFSELERRINIIMVKKEKAILRNLNGGKRIRKKPVKDNEKEKEKEKENNKKKSSKNSHHRSKSTSSNTA